jgi:hypothetical protein
MWIYCGEKEGQGKSDSKIQTHTVLICALRRIIHCHSEEQESAVGAFLRRGNLGAQRRIEEVTDELSLMRSLIGKAYSGRRYAPDRHVTQFMLSAFLWFLAMTGLGIWSRLHRVVLQISGLLL